MWGLGAADIAIRVADRFDEAGIEYAIGGALALEHRSVRNAGEFDQLHA